MTTAFQVGAFQVGAFQIGTAPTPADNWLPRPIRREIDEDLLLILNLQLCAYVAEPDQS